MRKCRIQEIIKAVPEVQTLRLSDNWFDKIDRKRSIFHSLYDWMLSDNRVPDEDKESLHNRTYVGDKLYRRLLAAEKKRIRGLHGLKGNDLDRAVVFSDMNSGPKTEIGELKIAGDAIIIIPGSSMNELWEFSWIVSDGQRLAKIEKIKSEAAGGDFRQWLISQVDRPDRIGDSAKDIFSDDKFPPDILHYQEAEAYLYSVGASNAAIDSLKAAWLEYSEQYPERIQAAAWCSECGQKTDPELAFVCIHPDIRDEFLILDRDCLTKFNRGVENFKKYRLLDVSIADLEQIADEKGCDTLAFELIEEKFRLWGIHRPDINDKGHVYFIQSEDNKAIKIGYTAGRPEERLRSLQTGQPHKLNLLCTMPGDRQYEKSLHRRFHKYRLGGEWFKPHPDVLALISEIKTMW